MPGFCAASQGLQFSPRGSFNSPVCATPATAATVGSALGQGSPPCTPIAQTIRSLSSGFLEESHGNHPQLAHADTDKTLVYGASNSAISLDSASPPQRGYWPPPDRMPSSYINTQINDTQVSSPAVAQQARTPAPSPNSSPFELLTPTHSTPGSAHGQRDPNASQPSAAHTLTAALHPPNMVEAILQTGTPQDPAATGSVGHPTQPTQAAVDLPAGSAQMTQPGSAPAHPASTPPLPLPEPTQPNNAPVHLTQVSPPASTPEQVTPPADNSPAEPAQAAQQTQAACPPGSMPAQLTQPGNAPAQPTQVSPPAIAPTQPSAGNAPPAELTLAVCPPTQPNHALAQPPAVSPPASTPEQLTPPAGNSPAELTLAVCSPASAPTQPTGPGNAPAQQTQAVCPPGSIHTQLTQPGSAPAQPPAVSPPASAPTQPTQPGNAPAEPTQAVCPPAKIFQPGDQAQSAASPSALPKSATQKNKYQDGTYWKTL